jgi:hypothetical protein
MDNMKNASDARIPILAVPHKRHLFLMNTHPVSLLVSKHLFLCFIVPVLFPFSLFAHCCSVILIQA